MGARSRDRRQAKVVRRISARLLVFILLPTIPSGIVGAQELDVYIVYSSGERAEKDEILAALPGDLQVKTYNADLLVLADYSGKQKVMSKIDGARIALVLGNTTLGYLEGAILARTDLVMVGGVRTSLRSDRATIRVLPRGTSIGALGTDLNVVHAASDADLPSAAEVRSADVVFVNGTTLRMARALALIIDRLLDS